MREIFGKVDLRQGDCLELMKGLPDKSIDMILCDLPYGVTKNKWDSVIPLDLLWKQYERIIKDNGAIVLNGQDKFSAKLMLSNEKLVLIVDVSYLLQSRQLLILHNYYSVKNPFASFLLTFPLCDMVFPYTSESYKQEVSYRIHKYLRGLS